MSDSPEAIFERAAERARQMGLPYAGAVTPAEAHALREAGAARLVDVRTPPEYQQVGHVPGTPLVVWPREGDDAELGRFVAEVREKVQPDEPLLLLCRSGARSHYAAHLLTHNGYTRAYNILEGFEGPPGSGKGWRAAGLPWEQG
ncbi:MAG TPA: rhodanese-like domain-containing protein [Usitatibacter sp.]|nr:rhodanese-like domain-containing protein [Usitatibacter sp.]